MRISQSRFSSSSSVHYYSPSLEKLKMTVNSRNEKATGINEIFLDGGMLL